MKASLYLISVLLLTIIFESCSYKNFTYNRVQKLAPTHTLKSEILNDPLSKISLEVNKENSLSNMIIIMIDSISNNEVHLYLKESNFRMEQLYYELQSNKNTRQVKGYFFYKDILVIIYGDVNYFFIEQRKPLNIMKNTRDIDLIIESHIPFKHYLYKKYIISDYEYENIKFIGKNDDIYWIK